MAGTRIRRVVRDNRVPPLPRKELKTLYVDEDIHKTLQAVSVERGVSLRAVVQEALKEYTDRFEVVVRERG